MPEITLGYIGLPLVYADSTFSAKNLVVEVADFNKDRLPDLLVLGAFFPSNGVNYSPQPGRLLLGDGKGGFSLAPLDLFPVNELLSVHPRKILVEDFNGDGQNDFYAANHGYDAPPFAGEQNLLFLSRPDGGWRNASNTLPQLADFTHTAATADIDGDGDLDILAGNGYIIPITTLEAPYMLMNDGNGLFTRDDSRLPIGRGEILDIYAHRQFPGTVFADMNDDGRPDLIVTADADLPSHKSYLQTNIFWNQGGYFDSAHRTALAQPAALPFHIEFDASAADFDGDGLKDLVLIGTNGRPYYDGWFVQVFHNEGNLQFSDISATVLPNGGQRTSVDNLTTGQQWPQWVRTIDFNGDLAPDFWVQYTGAYNVQQTTPIVWLNDGRGEFSTINVSAFVSPGREWQMNRGWLYEAATGYQSVGAYVYPGSAGLRVSGLISATPLLGQLDESRPDIHSGNTQNNTFSGGSANDILNGASGLDTSMYSGTRNSYAITRMADGYTLTDSVPNRDGIDRLSSIERLQFTDGVLAFDNSKDDTAGKGYLIYRAAFDRVPDAEGLGYWIRELDRGQDFGAVVAASFIASEEFIRLNGANTSNAQFVNLLYQNVLHRAGEAEGVAYWMAELNNGGARSNMLASFAVSAENVSNVAPFISDGIFFV